ncbi:MAG: hypothetical protein B7Y52_01715, partial [Sulfurovum sp. 28-43-6]
SDIEVVALKSEKADLKGYKTYQIIDESGFVDNSELSDDLDIDKELQQLIYTELQKKGKTSVAKHPDFYLAYLAAADMNAIKAKVDKKGQTSIELAPAGAMLLTVIDANTMEVIYLATAEGDVKDLPMKQKKERLQYAISQMMKGL